MKRPAICGAETRSGGRCRSLANATGFCAWHSGRGRHCTDTRSPVGMPGVRSVNEMIRKMKGAESSPTVKGAK